MKNIESAIERIKLLECPTGSLENRVIAILTDYNIADKKEISISREETLDKNGAQAYNVKNLKDTEKDMMILAQSGLDDYVIKVVDAYID